MSRLGGFVETRIFINLIKYIGTIIPMRYNTLDILNFIRIYKTPQSTNK